MAEKQAKKTNPVEFVGQVRQEARKVTWPTWRETMVTTGMVLVLTVFMGAFFFVVDWLAANGTQIFLNIGKPSAGG